MRVLCRHEPEHYHEYPDDWEFGGANGTDPAADPRWRGDTYTYWSDRFELLEVVSFVRCDDQALDHFTVIAQHFPKDNPHFVQVKRYGSREAITLPFRYNRVTDEVYDAL